MFTGKTCSDAYLVNQNHGISDAGKHPLIINLAFNDPRGDSIIRKYPFQIVSDCQAVTRILRLTKAWRMTIQLIARINFHERPSHVDPKHRLVRSHR